MAGAAVVQVARIANALGGTGTFRREVRDVEELHARILTGLPYRAFEAVAESFSLPRPLVLKVMHVPPRTLARRKLSKRFGPDESDRLTRLARIAALSADVLGSEEKAGRWLQKPNRALGGSVPLECLATEVGTRRVEDLLGRIAHGVFS